MKIRTLKILFPLGVLTLFLSILNSCKKDDPDPTPTLTFVTPNALTCQIGSVNACTNVATSSVSTGGAITYSVTPVSIATIDASTGVITPVAAGTATVTATQAAMVGKNGSASATYTLTITAPDPTPTLTFAAGPYTCAVGSATSCTWVATSTVPTGGTITYSITPATVATVNASTGAITAVSPGTAVVTATQAAMAGKNATATATYTLTVTGLSITSFAPLFGGVGYSVTITGTNFDGSVASNNSVTINGVATAVPTNISATSLTVLVPKGASGAGNIEVKVGTQVASKGTFTEYATVTTFAGDGTQGWNDATGLKAKFWSPAGLAMDNSGNVLVADGGNNRIRSITPAGVVTTIAGNGSSDYLDGNGTDAQFGNPHGIAVNPRSGLVFVTDKGDNHIRKINLSTGDVTTYAGSTYDGDGHDNGTDLSNVQFDQPQGIAIDAFDNIYMTDRWYSLVRELVSAGYVFSVGGNAQSNYLNGPGNNSGFYFPDGIVVDPSGDFLLVADNGNHAIRKITINGSIVVSTFAGTTTGTSGGTNDGTGTAASFSGPTGLVYDAAGNVYVTDDIGLIRKITPAGVVTTIAGRTDLGDSTPFLDGLGPFAKISAPQGITIDADGNLYVTDGSNRIRKIVP
jgi:sugar lactone lactonase YvrE